MSISHYLLHCTNVDLQYIIPQLFKFHFDLSSILFHFNSMLILILFLTFVYRLLVKVRGVQERLSSYGRTPSDEGSVGHVLSCVALYLLCCVTLRLLCAVYIYYVLWIQYSLFSLTRFFSLLCVHPSLSHTLSLPLPHALSLAHTLSLTLSLPRVLPHTLSLTPTHRDG